MPRSAVSSQASSQVSPGSSVGNVSTVNTQDVCSFFLGCVGAASDSTRTATIYLVKRGASTASAVYATARDYWTANKYANTNTALLGGSGGIIANILSSQIDNIQINSKSSDVKSPNGDSCNVLDPEATAESFAASLYNFSGAIQSARDVNMNIRFVDGQFSDQVVSGEVAATKAFIASQGGNFGPACSAMGIT